MKKPINFLIITSVIATIVIVIGFSFAGCRQAAAAQTTIAVTNITKETMPDILQVQLLLQLRASLMLAIM